MKLTKVMNVSLMLVLCVIVNAHVTGKDVRKSVFMLIYKKFYNRLTKDLIVIS